MHSTSLLLLAAVLTTPLLAQQQSDAGVTYIDPPNDSNGFCYYCSDDSAPAICNAQCSIAITRLCQHGDLTTGLTDTEQNCTIEYLPPTYDTTRNGAHQLGDSPRICAQKFNRILMQCGKDASTPFSGTVDAKYCTASGGGGNYGWKDDGTPLDNTGRYKIYAAASDQCGQHKAMWQEADKVIQWNPVWVQDSDQVKLITDAPAPTGSMAAMATEIPQENPECESEVCNLKQEPYYAHVPVAPWPEGGQNMMRHRMVYEGWSDDDASTAFRQSLSQRCGGDPDNYQAYLNGTGPQRVVDFNLSNKDPELCECASWAVYDASGGIQLPVNAFCQQGVGDTVEFNPIS